MKSTLLLSASIFLLSFHSFSQCLPSNAALVLEGNAVNVLLQNGGDGWWDYNKSRYEVPAVSGKTPVFSRGLWIGGMDEEETLRLAGVRYRQNGNDYWSGPIPDSTEITSAWCTEWNRLWKVTRIDIDAFLAGGFPSNDMITWPAKGNTNAPTDITSDLAPFKDVNGDGIYNIMDGDYPLIKGNQMVYWVFNDVGNVHTETGGNPLGFEFHGMAYSYFISDEHVINFTTFHEFVVVNKGTHEFTDLYLGEFVDIDLGNSLDDYVGVNVDRNLAYGYNGDPDDDGTFGYGTDLPMIGIQMEHGPKGTDMHNFTHLENGAGSDYTDPSTASEYYNFLSGLTRNGSPRINNDGDTTLFRYDGVPGGSGENMCDDATPGDYRVLQSYGPFDVKPNEVFGNAFSVIFLQDPSFQGGGCPDVEVFYERTDSIRTKFEQDRCQNFDVDLVATITDAHEGPGWYDGAVELVSLGNEGCFNYEWSNGANTRNIDSLEAGMYTVTISNHLGCSDEYTFEVDLIAGVETRDAEASFRVVPNPTQSDIQLYPAPTRGTMVKLYNMHGQLVMEKSYQGRIDLSNLQSGSYLVQIGESNQRERLMILR